MPSLDRARRRSQVRALARDQDGVVSRRQLVELGLTRWQVKAELRARRWRAHGRQTIATHTGDLTGTARYWSATFEAGPRAAIDGASALVLAGLEGHEPGSIRVSVPRGAYVVRQPGLNVRQTRRLKDADVVAAGVRRVRVEVAAVRAALWAVSHRQAALLIVMPAQQRLTTAEAIGRALLDVRRDKRRRLIEAVLLDVLDGAHSMGELDFGQMCRARRLPRPDRQVLRRGRDGRVYLDVYWRSYGIVVEIDGAQHLKVDADVPDALRQNALSLNGDVVLRVPVLGLRVAPDDFFAQITEALVARGWTPPS